MKGFPLLTDIRSHLIKSRERSDHSSVYCESISTANLRLLEFLTYRRTDILLSPRTNHKSLGDKILSKCHKITKDLGLLTEPSYLKTADCLTRSL